MFSKILVANRGEVAVRIIRACKEMGIETVAVYSEADRNSLPVALADERICIGGNAAAESYLNQKNIISAALATNAEAIHPGYGFLSENAGFAKLCEENGIVFIGPKSEVISAMGDKDTSRQLMQQVGVPVVPGTEVLKDVEEAKKYAKEIGYPLLVKQGYPRGGERGRPCGCLPYGIARGGECLRQWGCFLREIPYPCAPCGNADSGRPTGEYPLSGRKRLLSPAE